MPEAALREELRVLRDMPEWLVAVTRPERLKALGDVVSAQERPQLLDQGQAGSPGRQCDVLRSIAPC